MDGSVEVKEKEAQKCKEQGNADIRKKQFRDAIDNYTCGLLSCPDNIDLMSNRAFAHLQIGCYNLALSDINKVLRANPKHEKCLFRKVMVLWNLKKFEEAMEFVKNGIPRETLAKSEFQNLKSKCQTMMEQSKGIFDLDDIFKLRETKDIVAEFIGAVEIADVAGKGRGLLAAANIKPGQLIMCTKAFAFVVEEDAAMRFGETFTVEGSSLPIDDINDYCVAFICDKLSLDPSFRESFFDLYAGPSTTSDGNPSTLKTKKTKIDLNDVALVYSIVNFNGFRGPISKTTFPSSVGVWILPSYLNHSCTDANASFVAFQEFMFIRAAREIEKGEEITISYVQPDDPIRRKFIEARRFKCGCELCSMEDSESLEVREEIEKTLNLIQADLDTEYLETRIVRVRKLIDLRPDFPKTNLALLDPSILTICNQVPNTQVGIRTAAEIFEKMYEVAENCYHDRRPCEIAACLINCFFFLKDKKSATKWVRRLKANLMSTYGTIRCAKYFESIFDSELCVALGI